MPQKLIDHLVCLELDHYDYTHVKKISFASMKRLHGRNMTMAQQEAYKSCINPVG